MSSVSQDALWHKNENHSVSHVGTDCAQFVVGLNGETNEYNTECFSACVH